MPALATNSGSLLVEAQLFCIEKKIKYTLRCSPRSNLFVIDFPEKKDFDIVRINFPNFRDGQ